MKKTKINRLYDLYVDNPAIKDQEAAELLDTDYRAIGVMKRRLRDHGYIQIKDNSEVSILMPYKDQAEKGIGGLRLEVVLEMLEYYREDFRGQETFAERMKVGREIRLLLDMIR